MKAIVVAVALASTPALADPLFTLKQPERAQEQTIHWNDPKLTIGTVLILGGFARSVIWVTTTAHEHDAMRMPPAPAWLEAFSQREQDDPDR